MLEFLLKVVGFGLAVGSGLWLAFFAWDSIANYRIDNGHGGLANDGDDWAPFPAIPSADPRPLDPCNGVGECFDCGGPISPEKGCPACGLPPLAMPDIEQQVCRDILDRQKLGVAKYGTTVAENPLELREWLQHAIEECLDQAIYLKRAIAEIDERTGK